jgi:wobble nucleotide-excising tRNase
MINRIQLIRNIGAFDSANGAAHTALSRLTLIYAENGRGKTTLAAILRSLGTNDPLPIAERQRLASPNAPHVVLDCDGDPRVVMFQDNAWNRALDNILVFDDQFVDRNVYSGLMVGSEHRQNLHGLILGAQGVALNHRLQQLVAQIEIHNAQLRTKGHAISAAERGMLSVDDFCALARRADIDLAIQSAERELAAVREQEPIRNAPVFHPLDLPPFDVNAIDETLRQDLPAIDATALELVRAHFARLGPDAETWIADGMRRVTQAGPGVEGSPCPFCAQDLAGSPVLAHYRVYFSEEYARLKLAVAELSAANARVHGNEVPVTFEREVRLAGERSQFWSRFCEVPELTLDTAAIGRDWRAARDAVASALAAKLASPLDRAELSAEAKAAIVAHEANRRAVAALSERLQAANATINVVKQQAALGNAAGLASDIAQLKATKARHAPTTDVLCQAYLDEKAAKATTEGLRERAKEELDRYQANVFPAYQTAINLYLQRFNAGFRVDSMRSTSTRGGPLCSYNVVINNTNVPVGGNALTPGAPSFRNTLSAGDRNTLALAFFFASMDKDPALATKIIVIDDPMTSLDEHRSLTTVQEVRNLAQRARQVIALSHSKAFLCGIWQYANQRECTSLIVESSPPGSSIGPWPIVHDCVTEYDRQHQGLRDFLRGDRTRPREVARDVRHVLEGFLRRCCPEHFLPGETLGHLRGRIRDQPAGAHPILPAPTVLELDAICEYANRFHHETNPAWQTVTVNIAELTDWVRRTLEFVKK